MDTTPPQTTIHIDGVLGNNSWYRSSVKISLVSIDNLSKISNIYYKIDSGRWQQYSAPIIISNDGKHTIEYYSIDRMGNSEKDHICEVYIDSTPPKTLIHLDKTPNNGGWYLKSVNVSFSNNNDSVSKVEKTYYSISGQTTWIEYKKSFEIMGEGVYVIEYYSVDEAGNHENIETKIIKIENKKNASFSCLDTIEVHGGAGRVWISFDKPMNVTSFYNNVQVSGSDTYTVSWYNDNTKLEISIYDIEYGKNYSISFGKVYDSHGNLQHFKTINVNSPPQKKAEPNVLLILAVLILTLISLLFVLQIRKKDMNYEDRLDSIESNLLNISRLISEARTKEKEIPETPSKKIPSSVFINIPRGRVAGRLELIGESFKKYIPEKRKITINRNSFERVLDPNILNRLSNFELIIMPAETGEVWIENNSSSKTEILIDGVRLNPKEKKKLRDHSVISIQRGIQLVFYKAGGAS